MPPTASWAFDYLRDNMKKAVEDLVQRTAGFAIVDEADSVLIDEAGTPLIISGPSQDKTALYIKIDDDRVPPPARALRPRQREFVRCADRERL